MPSKLQLKKEEKKQNLINSAYELFVSQGLTKTSIDEIVNRANVAKGTFYLYFKDKSDIMQEVVYKISRKILIEAHVHVKQNSTGDFVEDVILLLDYIIEYFSANKLVLKLIERNFSWPLIKEKLSKTDGDLFLDELLEECFTSPNMAQYTKDEIFKIIFTIVELCGSLCYSSIINNQPDNIESMKPILYMMIHKILL